MDRLYTLFVTQSIDRYDDLTRVMPWVMNSFIFFFLLVFFLEKTAFDPLFFVQYSVIQIRYFWRNYFLNDFSLLDSLLRLVCLLMVHSYFIMIIDQQNEPS